MIKPILTAAVLFIGLSACQNQPLQLSSDQLIGTWHVETVLDTPAIYHSPANIVFAQDGQLTGNNSCHQFFGQYTQQGNQLQLTTVGATMKACIDSLMAQKADLMQAISLVQHADFSNGKLNLLAKNGDTLLVLSRLNDLGEQTKAP